MKAKADASAATVRRELQSDLDPVDAATDRAAVAAETGELGFQDRWDRQHLTVTVGFSASGYDALGLPAGHPDRPVDLVPAPWTEFGESPAAAGDGDVLLHINSDTCTSPSTSCGGSSTLAGQLTTVWALAGAQRYGSRAGRVAAGEARALIGFHDGLANLDPAHDPQDAALVFVDPQNGPAYPPNPLRGSSLPCSRGSRATAPRRARARPSRPFVRCLCASQTQR